MNLKSFRDPPWPPTPPQKKAEVGRTKALDKNIDKNSCGLASAPPLAGLANAAFSGRLPKNELLYPGSLPENNLILIIMNHFFVLFELR